jgi:hypothetical protein
MTRLFTVQEANDLIPTLTIVLRELIAKRELVQVRKRELAAMEVKARADGRESAVAVGELRQALEDILADMNDAMDRIAELGCELKDLAQGLIDFPSIREGRTVYLCWRLGEERVAFWHELEAGFAGRQPL